MARVITARRADTCRECSGEIKVGDQINYGGPGAISCATCRPLEAVKTRHGRRVYGGREHTGVRCEDAPCCGCCD